MTGVGPPDEPYRDYAVFGLRVRSNVELPELFPATGAAAPDVTIELGSVPIVAQGVDDGLNHVDGALVLIIPAVGRYKIEAGNRITVQSEPGVPERNVRLFLLGSAFGVLLHQRGMLPLHSNAIEVDGRAIAFMGSSGAGKSTLAAWFHDRGYRIIADDVCPIGFDGPGRAYAVPGLPRFRLWAEAVAFLGRDPINYGQSYAGREPLNKFDVPVEPESAVKSPTPLALLYLLDRGPKFSISPLSGVEAAEAVFANTYRGSFVPATGGFRSHWESATQLVQTTPMFRVVRQWNLMHLDAECRDLLDHARAKLKGAVKQS